MLAWDVALEVFCWNPRTPSSKAMTEWRLPVSSEGLHFQISACDGVRLPQQHYGPHGIANYRP